MPTIDDDGKIWIRGTVRPEYGVRVKNRYFVTGGEATETIECCVEGKYLWADLHDAPNRRRTARRFALDGPAQTPATLFNGFDRTPHGDIRAVTYRDPEVRELVMDGEGYLAENIGELSSAQFLQLAARKMTAGNAR